MKKIKVGHPGKNLGKYLVKAKGLPKGGKLGGPTVSKPTRKRIRKMVTPKPKGI